MDSEYRIVGAGLALPVENVGGGPRVRPKKQKGDIYERQTKK